MSQTKADRKRQQRRKDRENAIAKNRNIQHSLCDPTWRLDVYQNGSWIVGVRHFRKPEQVRAQIDETERLRSQGTEIIPGRIVNLKTGKTVEEIAPSPAKPEGKGALPDKLAGSPEAAKKGLLGIFGRGNGKENEGKVQNPDPPVQ
jgi:hypothetical protein